VTAAIAPPALSEAWDETWLDWVAVERAITSKPVGRPLTDAEMTEATQRMYQAGISQYLVAAERRQWRTERANAGLPCPAHRPGNRTRQARKRSA
jgi:hypothetical protein